MKLEVAESDLLVHAASAWRKRVKHHRKAMKKERKDEEALNISGQLAIPPLTRAFLDELVPPAKRPHHRIGFMGLIGAEVDTIDWCKVSGTHLHGSISLCNRS
jgi:hypothetical protein